MPKAPLHIFHEPVSLARRPVAAMSRPGAEKRALAAQLQAVHAAELEKAGFQIIRLLENEQPLNLLPKFLARFYESYVYSPSRIKIKYADIQEGATADKFGRRVVLFVYIPFEVDGEEFVLKIFKPADKAKCGDLIRDPSETLYETRHRDFTYQYIWREDYEDIRLFCVQMVFDADAQQEVGSQYNQTHLRGNPHFRELMAYQLGALVTGSKRVLSIGPGQGEFEELLVSKYGMDVEGIELSPEMAAVAREKGLKITVGDAHEMSKLVSGQFDAVVFPESIGYLRLEVALKEAARILAPGGLLFVITYTINEELRVVGYERLPYVEMSAAIETAGFKVEGARTFVQVDERGAVMSKKGTDLSKAEKTATILYIRAARI